MGGKKDPNDLNDVETAYRESKEEANITSSDLILLAELCPFITFNTVLVTPVIAYFNKTNFKQILNSNEVDMLFELPTQRFLSKKNHKIELIKNERGMYYIHYFKDHLNNDIEITTWGFTAFLSSIISMIVHNRNPEFDLAPSNKKIDLDNLNEFLQEYLFTKLAVSEAYYKK